MEKTHATRAAVIPLLVISAAQLMLVLDDSIVSIALPSIQRELNVDPLSLPWVVNAYILSFGALLLLGGRTGDVRGHRRALRAGIVVFIVASLTAGLSQEATLLIASRAVQGIGAAMAAPAALALIATTFSSARERGAALSLYGAMSGVGIVAGLILGGVLTDLLSWRWVFFINIPIGIFILAGSRVLVASESRGGRLSIGSAALGTGGMVAVVYAVTRFGEGGFQDPVAFLLLVAAAVLLAAFVLSQRKSSRPLVPLTLFADRNRTGTYLTMLGLAIGPMGTFYIVTLYLQRVRELTPLTTGLAWLPFAAGIILGAIAAPPLLTRLAPRWISAGGAVLGAMGTLWMSRISLDTSYWTGLAPAMLLIAFGFTVGVITLTQSAVAGVNPSDSGIASALLNSAQQIGAALGIAVLAAVAARISDASPSAPASLAAGYSTALVVSTGILLASALVAVCTLHKSPLGRNNNALS